MRVKTMKPWFVDRMMVRALPRACWAACGASGDVTEAMAYWRERLGFRVPREYGMEYLRGAGAWDAAELAELGDDELADRVLWMHACDCRETGKSVPLYLMA